MGVLLFFISPCPIVFLFVCFLFISIFFWFSFLFIFLGFFDEAGGFKGAARLLLAGVDEASGTLLDLEEIQADGEHVDVHGVGGRGVDEAEDELGIVDTGEIQRASWLDDVFEVHAEWNDVDALLLGSSGVLAVWDVLAEVVSRAGSESVTASEVESHGADWF